MWPGISVALAKGVGVGTVVFVLVICFWFKGRKRRGTRVQRRRKCGDIWCCEGMKYDTCYGCQI